MIKSPIDNISNTELVEEFDSTKIIDLYLKDYGIDVSEYFQKGKFQLRRCIKTKYRFFYPETLEGKEKLYIDLHKNRSTYYRFPKWEHQTSLDIIKNLEISELLEIGCATGDFIYYLKNNTKIQCSGIELNKNAADFCKIRGLNVYDEIIEEHKNRGLKYNLVCSFQVLEHIYDVNSFFINSLNLLDKNGYIIFGVPNSNPYLYYSDKFHTLNLPPHHIGLWDKKTIINVASHFNLEVIRIQIENPTIDEINKILTFWANETQLKFRSKYLIYKFIIKIADIFNIKSIKTKVIPQLIKGRNIVAVLKKRD
ncbi:class I SAM-dependent methyltransferase [Pedobacter aquae]|uniref:Class I SAM-dependent methyltransferase n=1 Tax=Pedobacter aquae TaxID=2605747 RepID=A0A5C0VD70_9SPHI|nr:methyltransferase domain-containing protein [Pedobacter aquae]QEK50336.1 class I SAM-dependent methyltransferase [Pedobacter aquae]